MKLWIAHPRAEEGAYPGEWAVSEVNGKRIANALSEDSAPRIVEAHNAAASAADVRFREALELRFCRHCGGFTIGETEDPNVRTIAQKSGESECSCGGGEFYPIAYHIQPGTRVVPCVHRDDLSCEFFNHQGTEFHPEGTYVLGGKLTCATALANDDGSVRHRRSDHERLRQIETSALKEAEAMRAELRELRLEKSRVFDIADTLAALIDKRFEELKQSIPKGGSAGRVCTFETDRGVYCNLPAPRWYYRYSDGRTLDLCSAHAKEMRGAKERE